MAKLFVSYSRRDSVAARNLIDSLRSIEQDVWVDWESIPPAVDWLEQIFRGIEESDAFIFLVSPDSVASDVCNVEISRAAQNNKRIIPIVLRDVDPKLTHENIRKLNWTFIRESDNFEEGLRKVKTAIELDLDWLEEHRRLQVRSLEWHRKKDVSLLLRGRDLRNARHMVATATAKDPYPTDLQKTFIEHSSRSERNRLIAWVAAGAALLIMSILSYTALVQSDRAHENAIAANQQREIAERNAAQALENSREARKAQGEAEEAQHAAEEEREKALNQERIASSQRSAARAQIYQTRTGELFTSTLLAIDSWQKSPSDEAEEILRRNISLLPLPVVQVSQEGNITALELGPDGSTFLVASDNGKACVRDLKDGTEVFCAISSTSMNDAIFARDGASIITGDEAGVVQVLSAADGTVEREFAAGLPVRDLDIGPDGKLLSIARSNGLVTIVDILNTRSNGYNLTLSGTLTVADFSPNGQWMAAGSDAGTVTVWNLGTRKIYSSGRHKGEVLSIQFSPNSRFLISGGTDNYAVGFDTQKGEEVFRVLHADWVEDITFPDNAPWFVTASDDARVRIWDLNTGKERLIMFQDGAITEVKISSDGKWIAATGDDRTVRVWSVYTGVEVLQVPLDTYGALLGFTNDNQYLIASDGNGEISLWDLSQITAPVNYIQFDKLTWISKFTPSGERLIAASANLVWSLDPEGLTTLGARLSSNSGIEFASDIYDLVISPDSQFLGISTYPGDYFIYDLRTRNTRRVGPAGEAYALAFSADSTRFITGTTDGIIETWDVKTGSLISTLANEGVNITAIAPTSEVVVAAATDKLILLDALAEQKTGELESPGENQFAAFNSDGSTLAVANSSGQVQRWKHANGNFEALETVKKEQPYSITFNPKGDVLAVATLNHVYLLDATTGEELSRIPHKGIVYNVSFSPDEKTLATASLKTIQLWDVLALPTLRTDNIIETACSHLISNFSESTWGVMFGDQPYHKLCEQLPVP